MASTFFSEGNWYVKWKGRAGKNPWIKVKLGPHPGAWTVARPPKKIPREYEEAAREYYDKENDVRLGRSAPLARGRDLGQYVDEYLKTASGRHRPGTAVLVVRSARQFVEWCKDREITTVEGVTLEACRSFLAWRMATIKASTARSERGYLSPIFSQAFDDGIIAANPWRKTKFAAQEKQVENPPFWTREECSRLVAACRGWMADFVIVGLNTGIRVEALRKLAWDWIHLGERLIKVPASESKSGKPYQVPISDECNDVLFRRALDRQGSPLVFPTGKGGGPPTKSWTYQAIEKAVKRSGVSDHGRYNHVMRHTFASLSVMAGVPLLTVSSWLGHSDIKMTQRYAHLCPTESVRHMDLLNRAAAEFRPANENAPG